MPALTPEVDRLAIARNAKPANAGVLKRQLHRRSGGGSIQRQHIEIALSSTPEQNPFAVGRKTRLQIARGSVRRIGNHPRSSVPRRDQQKMHGVGPFVWLLA